MVRTVSGCLTAWSQLKRAEEPETNPSVPQQEVQPDATEGVDYEGSEPKNEPVAKG